MSDAEDKADIARANAADVTPWALIALGVVVAAAIFGVVYYFY
jgi:hypothetical protein